jgi:hypothetical protein
VEYPEYQVMNKAEDILQKIPEKVIFLHGRVILSHFSSWKNDTQPFSPNSSGIF